MGLFLFLLSLRGLGSLELEVDLSLKETLEGRGHLEKTFERWGPNFHVGFDVQIKSKAKWSNGERYNILQLTTGPKYESIPGVWLEVAFPTKDQPEITAYLVVGMNGKGFGGRIKAPLEGYGSIKVDLRLKYGAVELTVDDQRISDHIPIADKSWQDVQFWLPSPFSLPASKVANIKNVVVVNEPRFLI